jgi:hypothetical protein
MHQTRIIMLHQVGYFLAWVEWCEADLIPYKAFLVAGFGAIFSISQAFSGSECFLAGPPVEVALPTGSPVASSGLEGQPHSISRVFF